MNSSIQDIFNDIFSNEYDLNFFLNCFREKQDGKLSEKSKPQHWLERLKHFYENFLKTKDGIKFKRWLPEKYDEDHFVREYLEWFYFFFHFQKTLKVEGGDKFLYKRLLFFQPLFLTKPFIFYIKRILRLNYIYTYFVDLNKPSVYSLFKELDDFKCYFPWHSGFSILANYNLASGIEQSNIHLKTYILNLIDFKYLYNVEDEGNNHLHLLIDFINLKDIDVNSIEPQNLAKSLKTHFEEAIDPAHINRQMKKQIERIHTAYPKFKSGENISINEALIIPVCLNFCLQDIVDKLMEDLRDKTLPEINSNFSRKNFKEVKEKNPYMRRFQENDYENSYYYSPQIDLFSLDRILADRDNFPREEKQKEILEKLFIDFLDKNRDVNRNKIIDYLYYKHKKSLRDRVSQPKSFKLLTFNLNKLLSAKTNRIEAMATFRKIKWQSTQNFLKDEHILDQIKVNFGDLLSPFVFRRQIETPASNFDYGFIGLKLSNLRHILEEQEYYNDTSIMYYEIHQLAAFEPLENYDDQDAQKRLHKVKNFFSSLIKTFAIRIVANKMSHIVEQKTTSDVTAKWAHALKTRIEFLKPMTSELNQNVQKSDQWESKKSIAYTLENRVMELADIAILIYEFSKDKAPNRANLQEQFKKFDAAYKNSPGDYKPNHLVKTLQECIKTALGRIITDNVYYAYAEIRKNCLRSEFFERKKVPQGQTGKNKPSWKIPSEIQSKLFFDEKTGLTKIDQTSIATFLNGIYEISLFRDILIVDCDPLIQSYLNRFILKDCVMSTSNKRFSVPVMISLILDELLLNCFKYFDINRKNQKFIKITIFPPKEVDLSRSNKKELKLDKGGYTLPIMITNTIASDMKKQLILNHMKKERTGLQSIEMGLSLLQEKQHDHYFTVKDGEYFSCPIEIPVYLSGISWQSVYKKERKNGSM